jgi:hypothetical protein
MLQRTVIILLAFLSILSASGQKKKLSFESVKADTVPAVHWQPVFTNLNGPYYFDAKKLKEIQKLLDADDQKALLPLLEDYVSHFNVNNFIRDIQLLWKLGQLYEVLGKKERAVSIYRIVLKQHQGQNVTEVLQHFNNWERFVEKNYYVPLQTYYDLVGYRKNIDTLVPPRSVFLNMGELVNDGKYPDYGPAMNKNNDRLIFTKRKKSIKYGRINFNEEEDLWFSINYDGFWDEAQPFGPPVNTSCNEGSACLSRDGKTMFFARCKVSSYQYDCADCMGSCDIYVTHLINDTTWSKPANLGHEVNSTAWDSQPTLNHTEDTLYFASDRLGGFGLSDIYYSIKQPDGSWSKAYNMGPTINTRENEVSPFYHPQHHVFYFSSNGHLLNFGNYDIFKSHKLSGRWQEPKNIGPLVNGKGSEYYFTIDSKSKDLFYSKAEENDKNLDLFSFPLPMEAQPLATTSFKGTLKDSVTGKPFKGIVSIIDLDNGVEVAPKFIKEDGSYEFDLVDKNNYLLVIQGEDFFRVEEKFYLNGDTTINIEAPNIRYNRWKFATLEFENKSAKILPEMEPDLDKLVNFLVDNPDFKLKISGHTDSHGNADYNLKLSQQRADAIKEYIMNKGGIASDRIDAIGFGSQKPIVEEKSEADMKINRRVEFELIKPESGKPEGTGDTTEP